MYIFPKTILQLSACALFIFTAFLSATESASWSFSNTKAGWGEPYGITLIQEKDSLLLDIYEADSRLVARNLSIPCSRYTKIRITYRASEFTVPTNGELYYATDKHPEIEARRCFGIPPLNTDGKVHEIVLNVSGWRDEGIIKVLRLDLVNQAPGLVYLMKVEFLEK